MNKYISGAYLVGLNATGSGSQVLFPDVDILRGKRIKHIDFITLSKTPDNNNAVTTAANLFITLREKNTQQELIKDLPCAELVKYDNRMFINKIVDWSRSYISGSGLAALTGKYLQLVIWFDYPDNWGIIPAENRTEINNFEIKLVGKKTFFPEKIDLSGRKFQNILLNYPGITPQGNEGMDASRADDKFVTLSYRGVQFFSQVPLFLFFQTTNNYQLKLQNVLIDMQSSFVETWRTDALDKTSIFFNCILDDNINA